MKKNNLSVESFAGCMSQHVKTITDRSVAFLYFHAIKKGSGATLKQIITDFSQTGLGTPNITKLRKAMIRDRRTIKISNDEWRLKSDKLTEVETELNLSLCFNGKQQKVIPINEDYVDKKRFQNIRKKKSKFDFSRLLQMLTELNSSFSIENYISVILLVRAILDHIPPIFNYNTFSEVANNYGTKSFKDSMSHLENSSRKIADSYLHTKIRTKESLPNKIQVNFSSDLDVLLAEVQRIS